MAAGPTMDGEPFGAYARGMPARCPLCGAATVPISYGPLTREIVERARRGELRIGGRIPIGRGWWCAGCDRAVIGPGERAWWASWK